MNNKTKVHVEEFDDVLFTWERDLYAADPTGGDPLYLGTTIRINNQIIALEPLTDKNIETLREAVNEACDHELEARRKARRKNVSTEDSS